MNVNLREKLRNAYYSAEDRYYGILDELDGRGVDAYWLVNPVEDAGIPTLPIVVGLLLIFSSIVAYALMGVPFIMGTPKAKVVIQVAIDGEIFPDLRATVVAYDAEKNEMMRKATDNGLAVMELPENQKVVIVVSRGGCRNGIKVIESVKEDTIAVDLNCAGLSE